MPTEQSQLDDLPDELVAALKDEHRAPTLITSRVDREITKLGEAHFREREGLNGRKTPIWFAAAASVLLAVVLIQTQQQSGDATAELLTDVDNSGQVDIADVLALARDSKTIRQEELDLFARQLVVLGPSGDAS